MRMFSLILITLVSSVALANKGWEKPGVVKCYSGDKVIYEGKSGGRIERDKNGFLEFVDEKTNEIIVVGPACVVRIKRDDG
jgi:hypothetical protein